MDDKILELLNQLLDGQKDTTQRIDRSVNKIDNVVDQAAQLKEFRAETKESLNKIIVEVVKQNKLCSQFVHCPRGYL